MGVSSASSSRRKWIVWLSLLGNVLLVTAAWKAWQDHQRQVACIQSTNGGSARAVVTPTPDADEGAHRRLLSLRPIPSILAEAMTPAGRRLLESPPKTLGTLHPAPTPGDSLHVKNDLSDDASFDVRLHEFEWQMCPLEPDAYHTAPYPFCEQTAIAEQKWQMSWFGQHVVAGPPRALPGYLGCTHIPPPGYQWPEKDRTFPATGPGVHFPNLRIDQFQELTEFNKATPKNLYHFDAPKYDLDALEELSLAEQYIPFQKKIRLMLDVGAGGGSLGLLAKKKYDVQTLSTVFADWPYCEYITLRGGNCILLDVMEALPMAKFSFDVLHVSWVYHGQTPDELRVMFHELNRILRPGGYLWLRGGWARSQFDFLQSFLRTLGYTTLYTDERAKPAEISKKIFFGSENTLPYAVDWTAILVKPIEKAEAANCIATTPARTLKA